MNRQSKVYSRVSATKKLSGVTDIRRKLGGVMDIWNKAGYTAIQSRTVGQELYCESCSKFKNVMDAPTYRPTDRHGKVESRVSTTVKSRPPTIRIKEGENPKREIFPEAMNLPR